MLSRLICFGFIGAMFASNLHADVLDLYYKKVDLGGSYQYDFKLVVTNNDSSFAPGQGFNWITFGDVFNAPSTLPDFSLNFHTFPNPNMTFTFSGGGHNGPTFLDATNVVTDGWLPTGVGDFVTWQGTSAFDVPDGQLLFSTLIPINGATPTNFKAAIAVPEPTSGLVLVGLICGVVLRRRR